MENRSPAAVLILTCVTFGIYGLIWYIKTKDEMVAKGAEIPSFIMMFIPIANLIWVYKYCQGVEKVTGGETSTVLALVLIMFLGVIGMAVLQSKFNQISA